MKTSEATESDELCCAVCGNVLTGSHRKFCSAECRKIWHISGQESERGKRISPTIGVAMQARQNGRSYGQEVLQAFLAQQSEQMRKSREKLKQDLRREQIAQELKAVSESIS